MMPPPGFNPGMGMPPPGMGPPGTGMPPQQQAPGQSGPQKPPEVAEWSEHRNAADGRMYYYNSRSQESTWKSLKSWLSGKVSYNIVILVTLVFCAQYVCTSCTGCHHEG